MLPKILICAMASFCLLFSQARAAAQQVVSDAEITFFLHDENRVVIQGAQVHIFNAQFSRTCETDFSGHCQLSLPRASYSLKAEKSGFYAVTLDQVQVGQEPLLEIALSHEQEVKETVNVAESRPTIDPEQTASTQSLDSNDVINVPYPTTRDVRYLLPFIPGVVMDRSGNVHVAGAQTYQTLNVLDGFNATDPVNHAFNLRVSADAIREISVQDSRYSAQYGKASAGVIALRTGMGDDHLRFSATNFVPSFQFKKGFGFDKWVPRATFSGPLLRGKAWFFEAPDAEYDTNIIKDLPDGADRAPFARISNLSKAQVNLSGSDILTGSFLYNWQDQKHAFLSLSNPLSATPDYQYTSYFSTLKEQHLFANGTLAEVGLGWLTVGGHERPLGTLPFTVSPESYGGNFFRSSDSEIHRLEGIVNVFLAPVKALGSHELQLGLDTDRLTYYQSVNRRPISFLNENGTLGEQVTFPGPNTFGQGNIETGTYIQDRWSPSDRIIIEPGIRFDWDTILHDGLVSPRIAGSSMLAKETKISAGVGLFYDATNLAFLTFPLEGPRVENFYAADGVTLLRTDQVFFRLNQTDLQEPRSLNSSVELEQKLPKELYLRVDYLRRRGERGFIYREAGPHIASSRGASLFLTNARQDHYDAVQTTIRHSFRTNHFWMVSYTRSAARSNQVLGFGLDQISDPLFTSINRGPLGWDTPNRMLSYGWLPVRPTLDFAYTMEWRTGYPFSVVNQQQNVVGAPNSRRFPDFFDLGTYLEKRFDLFRMHWALRGGFDNVTNHRNPSIVDNNIDSPGFLRFRQFDHRSFVARIRFLGRKK